MGVADQPGEGQAAQATAGRGTANPIDTLERDTLHEFKMFTSQQRLNAEKMRTQNARQHRETTLGEVKGDLKAFARQFKLQTSMPADIKNLLKIADDPSSSRLESDPPQGPRLSTVESARDTDSAAAKQEVRSGGTPRILTKDQQKALDQIVFGSFPEGLPQDEVPGPTPRDEVRAAQ